MIGYLGPHGTFSEEAAHNFFGKDCEFEMFSTNEAVVEAVNKGEIESGIDEGIAAFDNSLEGGVNKAQDAIIASSNVKVKGELLLPIKQNLIAASANLFLKQIEIVVSHPQALAQCKDWIKSHLPHNVEMVELAGGSTAQATKELRSYGNYAVAIGSEAAAEYYERPILAEAIQDGDNNFTRFLVLSRKESNQPTGRDKTSIIFEVLDQPGALVDALLIFKTLNINMTNIQSRPTKKKFGEVIFFLDIDGHRGEEKTRVALKEMQANVKSLRVLGSYPKTY